MIKRARLERKNNQKNRKSGSKFFFIRNPHQKIHNLTKLKKSSKTITISKTRVFHWAHLFTCRKIYTSIEIYIRCFYSIDGG